MNPQQQPKEYDLFLSYCSCDREIVVKLAEVLRQRGLTIFLDIWELKLGDVLSRELETALSRSNAGLVFFSRAALQSPWVRSEYDRMVTRAISGDGFRLIPIRLEDCDIPGFARDRVWYDLSGVRDDSLTETARQILSSLGLSSHAEAGLFWSGTIEFADRLRRIGASLGLIQESDSKIFLLANLLSSPGINVREADKCACGGRKLCTFMMDCETDFHFGYLFARCFHICTRCLSHSYKVSEQVEEDGFPGIDVAPMCAICGYNWARDE